MFSRKTYDSLSPSDQQIVMKLGRATQFVQRELWDAMVQKYGLQANSLQTLASWWHTDGDLGRDVECFNSMSKSRLAGFADYQDTAQAFRALFARLRSQRIIP